MVQYKLSGQDIDISVRYWPPVVIFAYNRADLLHNLLEALAAQTVKPPKLIVYVDGPKDYDDQPRVQECLSVLKNFLAIPYDLVEHVDNFGCRASIVAGLKDVLQHNEAILVLEDDVLPGPQYYEIMSTLLHYFEPHHQVFSILPFRSPVYKMQFLEQIKESAFVTNRFNPWGFGTWANRWSGELFQNLYQPYFNPYGSSYRIPWHRNLLDIIILQYQNICSHQTEEWSISLILSCLFNNKVHVNLKNSLVQNLGFGHPLATHTKFQNTRRSQPFRHVSVIELPPLPLLPSPVLTEPLSFLERIRFIIKFLWKMLAYFVRCKVGDERYMKLVHYKNTQIAGKLSF